MTETYDVIDLVAVPTREWAAELERYGLLLAAALHYALEGDIQRARRLSDDVRVMGRPVSELSDDELAYLEEYTAR